MDEVWEGVLLITDGVKLLREWMSEYLFGVATVREVLAMDAGRNGLLLRQRAA